MTHDAIMRKIEAEADKHRPSFRTVHNASTGMGGPVLQVRYGKGKWTNVPDVPMSEPEYFKERDK